MDYRKQFFVSPGKKLKLAAIDPAHTGGHTSSEEALPEIQKNVARMAELQALLYADGNQSLLVVLQALDAAGKDGVVRHLFSGMNPQGTSVFGFKQPSAEEAAHDFLWRAHQRTPARGEIVVFNRSHYEDVLVVRVHNLVPKSVWSGRYELIRISRSCSSQNGTRILKFFLHISPEEQLAALQAAARRPGAQLEDQRRRLLRARVLVHYVEAYEEALSKTSSKDAPWYVIPANHKWFRNLAISQIIADTMEDMGLKLPPRGGSERNHRQVSRGGGGAGKAGGQGGKTPKPAWQEVDRREIGLNRRDHDAR
jgi:PPK2 family polyphosphate:nucleotide phosphotransferase